MTRQQVKSPSPLQQTILMNRSSEPPSQKNNEICVLFGCLALSLQQFSRSLQVTIWEPEVISLLVSPVYCFIYSMLYLTQSGTSDFYDQANSLKWSETQSSPKQRLNFPRGQVGGFVRVRLPLSLARSWKTQRNKLSRKGVMIKKMRLLGLLNVRIVFLQMSSLACPKKPKGYSFTMTSGLSDNCESVDFFEEKLPYFSKRVRLRFQSDLPIKIIMISNVYSINLMVRCRTKIYFLILIIIHQCTTHTNSILTASYPKRMLQGSYESCNLPGNNSINAISIGSCPNQIYIVSIGIGTQAQPLYNMIGTDEPLQIILNNSSSQVGFVVNSSSTVELSSQTIIIQFGNGQQISSLSMTDMVTFFNTNIDIRSQLLFVEQQVANPQPQVISGILGLGIDKEYVNIFELAFRNKQINSSSIIISLTNPNEQYVYFNNLPQSIISSTIFLNRTSEKEYSLAVIGMSVGQTDFTDTAPKQALVSLQTQYFAIGQKLYQKIASQFFSSCSESQQHGTVCSCSTTDWPTFSFMLDGAEIYLPKSSYLVQLDSGLCTYGFTSTDDDDYWIIFGTSLFLSYNVTLQGQRDEIGLQGIMKPIQGITASAFDAVFLFLLLSLTVSACILIWYLRMIQKQQSKRTIQFSISDRFIETQ